MVFEDDITRIVVSHKPASLLVVTPKADGLVCKLGKQFPDLPLFRRSAKQLLGKHPHLEPSQLGLVLNTLEYMTKQEAGILIARLRDIYCRTLYLAVLEPVARDDIQTHWKSHELIAFGMHLVKDYEINGKCLHLYYYDIYDYKDTPDWLNSKNWANPDMWGKARW